MSQGDALQMVSHLDDLQEIWETLDTCYERPDKYMEEALRPIVDFRRYKIVDSAAVREFYSLLRAAIKGAKGIGRIGLLINDQTIPKIMGKMPYTDWREWATRRPDWMQQDVATAFEGFVEEVAGRPQRRRSGAGILAGGRGEGKLRRAATRQDHELQ
jgi:hypothetical protein